MKKTADEEDGRISNKKPRKATLAKDKLYGRFVKVTFVSNLLQPRETWGGEDAPPACGCVQSIQAFTRVFSC